MNKKARKKLWKKEAFSFISFISVLLFMVLLMGLTATPVLANGNNFSDDDLGLDRLDKVIDWVATWAGRIGLVIAFFGGLQTVLGFMNDDADSKVRGLKLLAAGFMVWGIAESYDLLFTD